MKRYTGMELIRTIGVAMALSLLISGCGNADKSAVPAGAKAGDLLLSPCSIEVQGGKAEGDCGTLIVPENRQDSSSRLIALPVIRVRATSPDAAEPIFWLEGGPGQTNLAKPPAWMYATHDVVFVGYRGVDGWPKLDCPEYSRAFGQVTGSFHTAESRALFAGAMSACASRLKSEGVDLAGYTVPETAADLESARAALGYDRIHLYSLSYGTRVAQIFAARYPERVYRSAMVGVNPPGHFIWEPDQTDDLIRYYAQLCAADPACSARTPDLAETMRNVLHTMPERWLVFPIHPDKVRMTAFAMLLQKNTAAMVFDAFLAAEQGDAGGLALLSLAGDLILPNLGTWGEFFSKGYSADYDPARDYDSSLNPPDAILGAPISRLLWSNSLAWPTPVIAEEFRRAMPSEVETLLISGSVDFSTPPDVATKDLLPTLRNSQRILLKEMGHTQDMTSLQPAAYERLIISFFDTGKADDSLFRYDPMRFEAPLGLPLIAKLLLGSGIGLLLLAILAVVLILRRWLG